MNKKFNHIKLWSTIAIMLGYFYLTGQIAEYAINREVAGELQLLIVFLWGMVSYYTIKLVKTNFINLFKQKQL
jgi:hypothetical protein